MTINNGGGMSDYIQITNCPGCHSKNIFDVMQRIRNGYWVESYGCKDCKITFREIFNLVYHETVIVNQTPQPKEAGDV
jgi:hypothetical protein